MSLRAMLMATMSGLAAVLAASSADAQQAAPTSNTVVPTPSPSPAPKPGAIGPAELQNFNLDGTVTRRAEPVSPPANNAPPAATSRPAPASPAPTPAPSRASASPAPAPRAAADTPAPTPSPRSESPASPASNRSAPTSVPAPLAASPEAAPAVSVPEATSTPDLMPPPPAAPSMPWWPWALALVAAIGGGAWWLLRRRDDGEEGRLAFAGPVPQQRATAPSPSPAPAPTPTPPSPAPRNAPPASDGGIVSRALQPKLAFELSPLLLETDEQGAVRLTFDLIVANVGSSPARDVRVEAKMFNAGPNQDAEIGQFFSAASGLGAKLPPIGPQDRVPLRSRIGMTPAEYQALNMAGRALVVPMVAVNAVYRGPSGETIDSASWLVGKAPGSGEAVDKLGPFGLDKPQSASTLAARMHSAGIAR